MLEPYFSKVEEFHLECFPVSFLGIFRYNFFWGGEGVVGQRGRLMLKKKNHKNKNKKDNKNTAFVRKEGK